MSEGERARRSLELHQVLARGGGWAELLRFVEEEAREHFGEAAREGQAAMILWDGPGEFFQKVKRRGSGRGDGLATLLSRHPDLRRSLEAGEVARAEEEGRRLVLLPICGEDGCTRGEAGGLLGALCIDDPGAAPEALEAFRQRLEAPCVQLSREHRQRKVRTSYQEENRYFRERERRHYLFKDLVCESKAMRRVYDELSDRVEDDQPLFLTGEGGSGKELMARAAHHLGDRQEGMLIKMSCAEFPEDLVDIELFGCVASELTGAVAPRKGIFELAQGGTVFLDEIDGLSLVAQGKIVRVLKEREVRRIGDAVGRPVDARLIASSHRDLEELCSQGRFRGDLMEQLQGLELRVPSLRERREDIVPLARLFLKQFSARYEAKCEEFDEELRGWLEEYPWPGNVRQLQTLIESAVLMARVEAVLRRSDLAL